MVGFYYDYDDKEYVATRKFGGIVVVQHTWRVCVDSLSHYICPLYCLAIYIYFYFDINIKHIFVDKV